MLGIGVEQVGAVTVDAYAVLIDRVVRIAGNVIASFDHIDLKPGLGERAGMRGASKPGSDDQNFSSAVWHAHWICAQQGGRRTFQSTA